MVSCSCDQLFTPLEKTRTMKPIKFASFFQACCLTAALFISASLLGCKTTNSQQSTIKLAAYVGTSEALLQHPEWKPKFEIAASDLYTLESSTNIDAASILAIASRLPVKELKSVADLPIFNCALKPAERVLKSTASLAHSRR